MDTRIEDIQQRDESPDGPAAVTDDAPGLLLEHSNRSPADRARWIADLTARATDPRLTDDGVIAICRELAAATRDVDERLALHDVVASIAEEIGWETIAGESAQDILEELDEHIFHDLADELRATTDPGQSLACYRRLLERGNEFDDRLAYLAAEHPHIPGRAVFEDFPETEWSGHTKALLRKLEREQAWRHLDELLEDVMADLCNDEILDTLEHPARHVERILERLTEGDGALPGWVWFTTIPTDHYETFAHHVSWQELAACADDTTWGYFAERALEALGHDPERWSVLNALATEFHGTLHELIETAREL